MDLKYLMLSSASDPASSGVTGMESERLWTGMGQRYLSGLLLSGVRAAGRAGNVALGKVVSGRHWSRAIFAVSRLQDLRDAASIWD